MKSIKLIFLATLIPFIGLAQDEIQVRKIWSTAPHNAFTDLVWFKDKFYCSFREGTGHIPEKDIPLRTERPGSLWLYLRKTTWI